MPGGLLQLILLRCNDHGGKASYGDACALKPGHSSVLWTMEVVMFYWLVCREPRGAHSSLMVANYALLRTMMLLMWAAYSRWFSEIVLFRSCDSPGEGSIRW